MSKYIINGEWKSDAIEFYGEWFRRFEAILSSVQNLGDPEKRTIVTIYLPDGLAEQGDPIEDDKYPDLVALPLDPGTIIIQLIPYQIIVGDPSKLSRPPIICLEDIEAEGRSIKVLAIPAS